jgi:hypothetical protein
MALKIIGAGLGRTGTMSLKLALEQLGFKPCYHMVEVFQNNRMEQWNALVETGKPDWNKVFEGYEATVDWPACNYYRELMAAYPDAKVILSLRDPESWFASTQATIFRTLDEAGGASGPMRFAHKLITQIVGPDVHDRAALLAAFARWNEEVKAAVPKEKLLVFEAKQGWKPLCACLGVPVPAAPYPQTNSTAEFQARAPRVAPQAGGV